MTHLRSSQWETIRGEAEENAAFSLEVNAHFYVAIIGESQLASSSFVYMYSFWLWEEAVWWRLRITMGRGSLQKRDRGVKNILTNIYSCSKVLYILDRNQKIWSPRSVFKWHTRYRNSTSKVNPVVLKKLVKKKIQPLFPGTSWSNPVEILVRAGKEERQFTQHIYLF